ncbi:MAG: DNA polymerase, partial [bacterium]
MWLYCQRLNQPKTPFSDFSKLTPEMVEYCEQDTRVNEALFLYLQKYIDDPEWAEALETEHYAAYICADMHDNGFYFDIEGAEKLYLTVSGRVRELDEELKRAFPPRSKLRREITPSLTKSGAMHMKDFKWLGDNADLRPFYPGATFSLIDFQEFNPSSPKQVVTRLNEAGWKPTEKTKGYTTELRKRPRQRDPERLEEYKEFGWKVSETNLETLPDTAPAAAHHLKDFLTLISRQRKLDEWFGAYRKSDHAIHGSFMSIGTWPHRMSHNSPNMGNNVALDKEYGYDMRALWKARKDNILVGVDMDAAHLRIFAHLIQDEEFRDGLVKGKKELGTDAHSINARALGLDPQKVYPERG